MLGSRPRGRGVPARALQRLRTRAADGGRPTRPPPAGSRIGRHRAAQVSRGRRDSQPGHTQPPAGGLREFWAPRNCIPPDVINTVGSAGAPPQEAEISAHWATRDFRRWRPRCGFLMLHRRRAHERVWDSTPGRSPTSPLFTASPGSRLSPADARPQPQPGAECRSITRVCWPSPNSATPNRTRRPANAGGIHQVATGAPMARRIVGRDTRRPRCRPAVPNRWSRSPTPPPRSPPRRPARPPPATWSACASSAMTTSWTSCDGTTACWQGLAPGG